MLSPSCVVGTVGTVVSCRGNGRKKRWNTAKLSAERTKSIDRKSLVPSASSLVLELLERADKTSATMSTTHTPNSGVLLNHPPSVAIVTNHGSDMTLNVNSTDASMAEGGDSNSTLMNGGGRVSVAAVSSTNPSAGNPHSVVPQLMDIYDDLTQSSTPQMTNLSSVVPMPPLPPPSTNDTTSQYSQGYQSCDSNEEGEGSSQASARITRQRSSSGSTTLPTSSSLASVASARGRRSKTKAKAPEIEEFPSSGSTGSGAGGRQPVRKKGKSCNSDNRWSKRFTWPDELHRDFVSAIFDVGLKHASPSAIMEFMRPNPEITSERVKSHLQKYRLNRDKSRKEFMTNYDSALDGFQKRFAQQGIGDDEDDAEGAGSLSCGEVAAHCTHASLTELREDDGKELLQRSSPANGVSSTYASQISTDGEGSGILQLPMLTAQEEDSPIGQAFGYLGGLYQALSQQLEEIRKAQGHVEGHTQIHQSLQPTLEEAAATAATMHNSDPYIHEVAACVPHASHNFMTGGSQSAGQLHNSPGAGRYHPSHHQYDGQYYNQYNGTPRQGQGEQQQQYNYAAPTAQLAYSPLRKGVPADMTNGHLQGYSAVGRRHSQPHLEIPAMAQQAAAMRSGPSSPTIHIPRKPQSYGAKVSQEEYLNHHASSQHTTSSPSRQGPHHGKASEPPSIPIISDNLNSTNSVNIPLSTGRTLQAQKESSLMKQEMRGQMAFQNKMRALMQIELSKSGVKEHAGSQRRDSNITDGGVGVKSATSGGGNGGGVVTRTGNGGSSGNGTTHSNQGQTDKPTELSPIQHQLMPEDNEDSQSLIWNPEDDDQIFDFLMEHS